MKLPEPSHCVRVLPRRAHDARLATACLVLALTAAPLAAGPPVEVRVSPRGIGPLVLGVPLREAAERAMPLDAAAALVGPGCDERDQVTVVLRVAETPMAVMAMADAQGRIEEILATPAGSAGVTLAEADACRDHGAKFAARLAPALGAPQPWSVQDKPVSTEFSFAFGAGDHDDRAARVVSRWFAGGRSCDLLLRLGGRGMGR